MGYIFSDVFENCKNSISLPLVSSLRKTFSYIITVLSHFCHVLLFVTLWTIAHQAPLSMGVSRQEHWSVSPCPTLGYYTFVVVQSLSGVQLFTTPWTAARQASLSTISQMLKLMSIESVVPSNNLVLCHPLLLLPLIFPSIRVIF